MKILGCKLVPVTRGTRTLKDAVDSAFEEYLKDPVNYFYAIGSVVGPHPFPKMVRDFQSTVGKEAREQFLAKEGKLPDCIMACVGGGCNAIGIFTAFLGDESVELVGVEPAGKGLDTPDNAATLTLGKKGSIHGMACYNLQDDNGIPLPVYSIASGLDYPVSVLGTPCFAHALLTYEVSSFSYCRECEFSFACLRSFTCFHYSLTSSFFSLAIVDSQVARNIACSRTLVA